MAKPTEEQLVRINQLALVPLTADETYVFPAKLIGDQLIESRYFRMTLTSCEKWRFRLKQGYRYCWIIHGPILES
ncbi:hypothetical protein [Paenibacillus cellulosilyticus]|uniref:hypothetical protein n=1 Tax=Paenibacillus cellulosilyticus TaxID=375489 RepID=UPI001FEEB034|nr:hypothetical protein [Paenibacillus cellulosilyticus]